MCLWHDCCTYLKPSHFCIIHKVFTCWFPQKNPTADSPKQQPCFPLFSYTPTSNPPLKGQHQNISNKFITTRQPTPHLPPWQTYEIHPADCNKHGTLPIWLRVSPVPCNRECEELLLLPRSLTSLPGQTPRAAASLELSHLLWSQTNRLRHDIICNHALGIRTTRALLLLCAEFP